MKVSERSRLAQIQSQKDQIMIDFFRNSLGYSEEEIRLRLSKASTAELQNNAMGGFGLLQGVVDHVGAKIDAANKQHALDNAQGGDIPDAEAPPPPDSSAGPLEKLGGKLGAGVKKLRTTASAGVNKVRGALGMPSKSFGKSPAFEPFHGFNRNDVKFIDAVAREFFKSTRHLDIVSDSLYKSSGVDNRPARYLEAERRVRVVSHAYDLFWMFNDDVFNKSLHVLPYLNKNYGINPFEFVEFLQKAAGPSPLSDRTALASGQTLASKILNSTGSIQDFHPDEVLQHARENAKGEYAVSKEGEKELRNLLRGGKIGGKKFAPEEIEGILRALRKNGNHVGTGIDSIDDIRKDLFDADPTTAQAIKTALKDAIANNAATAGTTGAVPWIQQTKAPTSIRDAFAAGTRPGERVDNAGKVIPDPTILPAGTTHYDHDLDTGEIHDRAHERGATPYGAPIATGPIVGNDSAQLFHKMMKDGFITPLDLSVSGTDPRNLHGAGGVNSPAAKNFRQSWGHRPKMVDEIDPTTKMPTGNKVQEVVGGKPQYEPLGEMETPMWHSGDLGAKSDRWGWTDENPDSDRMSRSEQRTRAKLTSKGLHPDEIDKLVEGIKKTGTIDGLRGHTSGDLSDAFDGQVKQTVRAHRVGFLLRDPNNPDKGHVAVEWDPSANGGAGQYVAGLHHTGGRLQAFSDDRDATGAIQGEKGADTSYGHPGLHHLLSTLSAAAPAWSLVTRTADGPQAYGAQQENAWTVSKNGSIDPTTGRNRLSDAVNIHIHQGEPGVDTLSSLSGLDHIGTGKAASTAADVAQTKHNAAVAADKAATAMHADTAAVAATSKTPAVAATRGDEKVSTEIHDRLDAPNSALQHPAHLTP
jgi:hypothetical protein